LESAVVSIFQAVLVCSSTVVTADLSGLVTGMSGSSSLSAAVGGGACEEGAGFPLCAQLAKLKRFAKTTKAIRVFIVLPHA
jgi:hypothetical protein